MGVVDNTSNTPKRKPVRGRLGLQAQNASSSGLGLPNVSMAEEQGLGNNKLNRNNKKKLSQRERG